MEPEFKTLDVFAIETSGKYAGGHLVVAAVDEGHARLAIPAFMHDYVVMKIVKLEGTVHKESIPHWCRQTPTHLVLSMYHWEE